MLQEQNENQVHLEWMLQNGQVDDRALAAALVHTHYHDLAQIALTLLEDSGQARVSVLQGILTAVESRHRYTGEVSLKAWLFSLVYRSIRRKTMRGVPPLNSPLNNLFVFLRYAQDLSIPEIAYVVGVNEKKAVRLLDQGRSLSAEAWGWYSLNARLPLGHGRYATIMQAARDDLISAAEKNLLEAHLCECAECKRYSEALIAQEAKWKQKAATAWPQKSLSEEELAGIWKTLEDGISERGLRRRFSLSIKEVSLGLTAVLAVLCLAWLSGMFRPERGRTVAAPQTRVVFRKITATPSPRRFPTSTPVSSQPAEGHAQWQETRAAVQLSSTGVLLDLNTLSARSLKLSGSQVFSSSGPVALALVLQYWGWKGSPQNAIEWLKPNPQDENVMVYELVNFVEDRTRYKILSRIGGEVELLRSLTRAGFPVIVQKGHTDLETEEWVGHYQVVLGYENQRSTLSLKIDFMEEGAELIEDKAFIRDWRAFDYAFLVVYPEDEESRLMEILGNHVEAETNARIAAEKASWEIFNTEGVDQFFAWFNRGASLTELEDYGGAAKAYDEAFRLYESLPEDRRPWRMLWYQTRPYWAYYYTGRFQELVDLATITLEASESPVLEESFYWRALAREALGDRTGAVSDLQKAVEINPHFALGLEQLRRLTGET